MARSWGVPAWAAVTSKRDTLQDWSSYELSWKPCRGRCAANSCAPPVSHVRGVAFISHWIDKVQHDSKHARHIVRKPLRMNELTRLELPAISNNCPPALVLCPEASASSISLQDQPRGLTGPGREQSRSPSCLHFERRRQRPSWSLDSKF